MRDPKGDTTSLRFARDGHILAENTGTSASYGLAGPVVDQKSEASAVSAGRHYRARLMPAMHVISSEAG